jgi:hypothetical protein
MKKKVIKDYKNLPEEIREAIKEKYPQGYLHHIITFFNQDKQLISALPYETDEISYLIKMPSSLHLNDEDEDTDTNTDADISNFPEGDNLEDLDEESYLIQEEEEEESD